VVCGRVCFFWPVNIAALLHVLGSLYSGEPINTVYYVKSGFYGDYVMGIFRAVSDGTADDWRGSGNVGDINASVVFVKEE